ncbi:MAG TPA: hypothetical protein VN802_03145 [Stellaceae bacterium]|nr:hypothetical protein [Stellaceae bacterium]
MSEILRGLLIAGFIALGGAGGALMGLSLDLMSPRRVAAGAVLAIIGICGGGLLLARRGAGSKPPGA